MSGPNKWRVRKREEDITGLEYSNHDVQWVEKFVDKIFVNACFLRLPIIYIHMWSPLAL